MGQRIRSLEDLEVWQLGKHLTAKTYEITAAFPERESYALTGQIRRAAVSVPGDVAEAFGRYHFMERMKCDRNARGSLDELKSRSLISNELGFLDHAVLQSLIHPVELPGLKLNNLLGATRRSERSRAGQRDSP